MFRGQHRKIRLLFGAADVLLIALAFVVAYWTRGRLELSHNFYFTRGEAAALLGFSIVVWVAIAMWWETYDRIESTHPRVILLDSFQQCLSGAVAIVLFEDRKSTRLNSSHANISYAVFCLK